MKFNKGRIILYIILGSSLSLITFSSLVNLYENKDRISRLITRKVNQLVNDEDHDKHGPRGLVNPLQMSRRQIPPKNIQNLKITDDAYINGIWSAPFDWNVTAIHSVLLPDETVMTFGSFGIVEKEDKDIRANKKIKLSDGTNIERDRGQYQWEGHDVNSGIDFDIWDIKKGVGDDAHKMFYQPIVMDSFCTVVRVLDKENVFMVGGNLNRSTQQPDTQNATTIYNVKNGTFKRTKDLNYKRWYGSVVRTGDEKLIIIGGADINILNKKTKESVSYTPEIIDLKNIDSGWSLLDKASNYALFGRDVLDEWNYPRSFLSSDGNVVGISHNKIWVMDKDDDYRVSQTGEIPLSTGGISRHLEHVIPTTENQKEHNMHNAHANHQHGHHGISKPLNNKSLQIVSMGGAVGSTSNTLMKGKDTVYLFGGKQKGKNYTSSNKVYKIDFSSSSKPKIEELSNMAFPRSNANSTILPNGEIFINGGEAYNDQEFSIFTPEIYNVDNQTTKTLSDGYFRRNYHSTSILLPNGTILVSGGDVWNSEIFYPPYLFTKNWENKTVLANRPKIVNFKDEIKRGELTIEIEENGNQDIEMITMISTGATTHAQASEPKFRSLEFNKLKNSKYLINIPRNPNEMANGTYMIFAVRSNGVPSEGKIVYLN